MEKVEQDMSNVGDDDPDPGHRFRFRPILDRPVVEVMEDIAPEVTGASSLDFLQAVYTSADQPMGRRMRAAIAALPFEHPKLAVTAVVSTDGFAAKLEKARQRVLALYPQAADSRVANPEGAGDIG